LGQGVDSHRSFIDMSGGLNSDASTYTMKDEESPDLRNVRTNPLGPIKGRLGVSLANEAGGYTTPVAGTGEMNNGAPFLNKPLKSLHRYYRQNGSHLLLFTVENYLARIPTLSGVHTAFNIPLQGSAADAPGLPVSDRNWSMATFRDWVYLTTQDSVPYRTDGVGLFEVGQAPSEVFTAVPVVGGALPITTYRYVIVRVYKDGLGDSPRSVEVSATTAGANLQIQLTMPAAPAARNDIVSYKIYRTLAGAAANTGPYYLVTTQAPSAVFVDNVPDNSLTFRLDMTYIQPHKAAFLTVHQNRLWLAKLTEGSTARHLEVMPSDANRPDQFKSDVAYSIRNPAQEVVSGIFSYNGVLYVTSLNQLFPVVGSGLERGPFINIPDYRVAAPIKGPGALNHRVIQQRNGSVFMTNKVDVWQIKGREIKPLSEYRLRDFLDLNLNRQLVEASAGVCTRDHYRVSFAAVGQTRPSMTLIYDFQSNAFLVDDGASLISYAYLDGDSDNLSLYAGEGTDNGTYLYLMDTGNQDWDPLNTIYKNIIRRWRSKDIPIGPIGQTGQPRILIIEGRQTGSRVTLNLYVNNNQSQITLGFLDFVQGVTTWGAFNWGDAKWATTQGGVQEHRIHVPQTALGERLAWEFVQEEDAGAFQIEMVTTTGLKEPGIRGAG